MRSIKEIGWTGFSVDDALTPLLDMGQTLFEPPDVSGWELGPGWFSTGGMLARMNFAAHADHNQRFTCAMRRGRRRGRRTRSLSDLARPAVADADFDSTADTTTLLDYLRAGDELDRDRTRSCCRKVAGGRAPDRSAPVRISVESSRTCDMAPLPSTRVHPGRRGRLHGELRRAGVPLRHRARPGRTRRNLVVLYLSGGNDALSTVIPYTIRSITAPADDRRPRGATCCRSAPMQRHAGRAPPRLTGLQQIFNGGRLAVIQRTGYPNSSRSHFQGTDIWSTAIPRDRGAGLAGPLPRHAAAARRSADRLEHRSRELPRTLLSRDGRRAGDSRTPATYAFSSPNSRRRSDVRAHGATRIASHVPVDRPHLSFVNAHGAGGVRHARSRRAVAQLHADGRPIPNTGLGAGAARRGRRDGARHRHHACSGCRPAASTRTPPRAPAPTTAPTTA